MAASADRVVDTKTILKVSKSVDDSDWRFLGRLLDIDDEKLESIEKEHQSRGLQEIKYQMLVHWQKTQGQSATVNVLAEVLRELDQDLAEKLFPAPKIQNTTQQAAVHQEGGQNALVSGAVRCAGHFAGHHMSVQEAPDSVQNTHSIENKGRVKVHGAMGHVEGGVKFH